MRKLLCGIIICAVFFFMRFNNAQGSKVIFCFWGTWSHFREGNREFRVHDIDPNLCTHITYAFFGLDENGRIKSLDPHLDFTLSNIAKTVALKQVNPSLKVMASVGGGAEGSNKYSAMASTPWGRANFIQSAVQFLQQNKFDGLDFDWEFPAQRGGSSEDRQNFVTLLSELKTALKAHNLLLTIAVNAEEWSARISYDIPKIAEHVDLINLMTYDFSGSWSTAVGFNAPLTGPDGRNVMTAINYWLQNGAPAHKITMGLGFYGCSFTLADVQRTSPGDPIVGAGHPGPYTRHPGVLIYNEICENLNSKNWKRTFDYRYLVPFATHGDQWVGYDDVESLNYKINHLKSLNLAGAMIWSIDFDDFRGICGEKFTLLKTVKNGLL